MDAPLSASDHGSLAFERFPNPCGCRAYNDSIVMKLRVALKIWAFISGAPGRVAYGLVENPAEVVVMWIEVSRFNQRRVHMCLPFQEKTACFPTAKFGGNSIHRYEL